VSVIVERCEQCGFDGGIWSDTSATQAIGGLPAQWVEAVGGLTADDVHRRPISGMWSVAEYADHVREMLFGMRFVLDVAVAAPGQDLGDPPEPRFEPEPRLVDVAAALSGIVREASELHDRLAALSTPAWESTVILGGDEVDPHWVARHAVHDATHHFADVQRLRQSL
jgi:hypothetical protein